MKLWKPILLILPAGLVAGVIGARLVDPRPTLASERASSFLAESEGALNRPTPSYTQQRDSAQSNRPGGYRPDLDWDEEVWPGSGGEAYGYYDDRRADGWEAATGDGLPFDDPASSSRPDIGRNRAAAEEAALAAERAAEEALRAADEPPPPASAAPAQPRTPAAPAEREPRTAEGELPAIW